MQDFFNTSHSDFSAFEAKFMSEFQSKNSDMFKSQIARSMRNLTEFFQITSRAIRLRETYSDQELINKINNIAKISLIHAEEILEIPKTSLSRAKKIGLTNSARRKICYFLSIHYYSDYLIAKYIG